MGEFETEYYYYIYKQVAESIKSINYVQLYDNSFASVNNNYNLPLVDKNGQKNSYFYVNKNILENVDSNILNGVNLETIKTTKGTLIFLNTYNSINRLFKTTTKPVFSSGYYSGKNIEITNEVLPDKEQTRKITIKFL